MSNPRFTIIIPHKNSPKELERCLNSIPDIEDIQVIVVDDNSDNLDEANFPGRNRHYTQVIFNHDGLGAGHARNVALIEAKGEWLLFSDADDYFVDNMYELICKSTETAQEDIIYFTLKIDREGEQGGYVPVQNYCVEHIGDKNVDVDYNLRYKCTQPWDKLIRHSLVKEHNIIFQETSVSNDYLFSVQTGYFAKNVRLIQEPLYVYVIRNNNSLWHIISLDSLITRIEVYCDVIKFQKGHGIVYEPSNVYSVLSDILYSYPSEFIAQAKYVSSELSISRTKVLFHSFSSILSNIFYRVKRKFRLIRRKLTK